ncbi:MAG: ribonuclease [Clostridia bacterium]|nr:ribonuclease [Clostridia bacterium]
MDRFYKRKKLLSLILAVIVIAALLLIPKLTGKSIGEFFGVNTQEQTQTESALSLDTETAAQTEESDSRITEDGSYTSKEDVADYIKIYGCLPRNFITKTQAKALGWEGGDLWKFSPGSSIGGDIFGNREETLPDKKGRVWYECDIDYNGGSRGAKRIVFSNDGLIYYTDDHYETFTQLY